MHFYCSDAVGGQNQMPLSVDDFSDKMRGWHITAALHLVHLAAGKGESLRILLYTTMHLTV